jgi:diguanylate cyclase (GGDEF)-like protein
MRRYFEQRAEEEIRRSARYQTPFCLLVADIDHFKRFNDSYGHLVGDEVIQLVAAGLKHSVRSGVDLVGRYGGEEMMLLLPVTDLAAGLHVAERIRESVAALQIPALQSLPEPPSITISIGVAAFPQHGDTLRALIEFADQGLYQAKEGGRNRVEVFAKPA